MCQESLVADPGLEPGTKAYETFMIPFQQSAINVMVASDSIIQDLCMANSPWSNRLLCV